MKNELLDEKQLIASIVSQSAGSEQAFSLLVKKYSRQLYWQIRRITRNHEESDDILQNVWVKVWKNLQSFQGESSFYTWLYRISRNETLNFLQKEKKHRGIELDPAVVEIVAGHQLLDQLSETQISEMLLEAIDSLPEKQALVFQLKYFEDLKYTEISAQLSTSEGALKASYHHAVTKIQDFLEKRLNHLG